MISMLQRFAADLAFDPELTRRKMIFLAGPRQSGKTTLAREWLRRTGAPGLYYSWDDPKVRQAYRRDPHFFEPAARSSGVKDPWIVLDEIHKASRWRDMLKGWYDLFGSEFRFLVTGSASLDLLRRGGDSLAGRYFLFHLFPLSFNEAASAKPRMEPPSWLSGSQDLRWEAEKGSSSVFDRYFERGPFPEPFLAESNRFAGRWRQDYLSLVVRHDLRDLTRIAELDRVESLVSLLPGCVGSPFSNSSVARDIEVAHTTVKKWMESLSRLFLIFGLKPYHQKVRRALRKEMKWYFTDWSHVQDAGPRLENMVASCLRQACSAWTEAGLGLHELKYFRTLDKTEIDFVVCKNGRPLAAIEVKSSDLVISPALANRAFALGRGVAGIQVVGTPGIARNAGAGMWLVSADRFLCTLP